VSEQVKRIIDYPAEITFKTVFRRAQFSHDRVTVIMDALGLSGTVSSRESRNGTFISVTFTAVFPSEEALNDACSMFSAIEGFVVMF
jgi:hypothetical protein